MSTTIAGPCIERADGPARCCSIAVQARG